MRRRFERSIANDKPHLLHDQDSNTWKVTRLGAKATMEKIKGVNEV